MPTHTLTELASRFGLELRGDGATAIHGLCTLAPGEPGHLSFLANPQYRSQLPATRASAVIVAARDAGSLPSAGLVAPDPYLAFARIATLFDPYAGFAPGVATSAVLGEGVYVPPDAAVGEQAVIEAGAEIGAGAFIGAGSFIGAGAYIGERSRLEGRVWIGPRVRIGREARINPGAVIGGRGFGLAPTREGWEEVPQIGSVVIGNRVEIGSNTTIDRGAIADTVIEDGAKIDNLVQIAHNVRIGAHTAIAACTGIAGSTVIGARCMIGGAVGVAGHLVIADDVVVLARATVTHSLLQKGVYGSGMTAAPAREWRKQVAGLRRLEQLRARVRQIEQQLQIQAVEAEREGPDHE